MKKCAWCGKKFDVLDAEEEYHTYYGSEFEYEEDYSDKNICFACASRETDLNIETGEEIQKLMGSHDWESDD